MLGNKQLLSVFFIVVMLLAVFFTMGYMLGRNSAPLKTSCSVRRTHRLSNARTRRAPCPPSAATPGKRDSAPIEIEGAKDTKPSAVASKVQQAPPKPIEIPAVTDTQPLAGQIYLQVLAVAKPEADVLAEVLVKKGFHAFVAPGPNDKVFRVLAGPAKDVPDAAKLKADLEAAGFKPFIKKY